MSTKTKPYRLSPRARKDLEEIWLYSFEAWSAAQADSYVSELLSACEGLANGERIGTSADIIREGYYKYFSGSHAIYYKLSQLHVDVIRILHQSRDIDSQFT